MLGWIGSCRRQDEEHGCVVEHETLVDGGLQCGQPFAIQPDPAVAARFGVKAVPYVTVDLAGVVRTDTLATVLVLLDVRDRGDGLDLAVEVCHVEFPRIEVPGQPEPTFLDLVPEAYDALNAVEIDGHLSSAETCGTFDSGTGVFVFGARLLKNATDPLPQDPFSQTCVDEHDNGCLYDLESDGYIGATMMTEHFPILDVTQLQVAMRTAVQLSGTVVDADRFIGRVVLGLEIEILGCRLAAVDSGGGGETERDCTSEETDMVQALNPQVVQLVRPESPFVAMRLSQDVTCADLRRDGDAYFGR
jgi:hypothetical protein